MSGERYLRLLVEAALDPLAPETTSDAAFATACEALVAAGCADEELARGLGADLALARGLREGRRDLHEASWVPRRWSGSERRSLPPRAVAAGPARFDLGTGGLLVVTSITAGPDGATIHAWGTDDATVTPTRRGSSTATAFFFGSGGAARPTARPVGPARPGPGGSVGTSGLAASPRRRPHLAPPGSLEQLRVTDDRGTVYGLGRGGGSGGPRWAMARALIPAPDSHVAWWEVSLDAAGPVRLTARPSRATLTGRPHGRAPGAAWILGRISTAVAGDGLHPLRPGVRALLAVGAIEPGDPLVHQAALLDDDSAQGIDPGLDARWRSAIERRGEPPRASGTWAIAAPVDLGDVAVRLDVLDASEAGTELTGWCSPFQHRSHSPLTLTAFDDRHNWYACQVVTSSTRPGAGAEVTWRLAPELDAEASTLRIDVAGRDREASVEVRLQ
jgi:hypothetical protein